LIDGLHGIPLAVAVHLSEQDVHAKAFFFATVVKEVTDRV
jgi:hypothetical protein